MKRIIKSLVCLTVLLAINGCGVFKKKCNCPKVASGFTNPAENWYTHIPV